MFLLLTEWLLAGCAVVFVRVRVGWLAVCGMHGSVFALVVCQVAVSGQAVSAFVQQGRRPGTSSSNDLL